MFSVLTHNGRITINHNGQHRTFQIRTQPEDATFAPGRRVVGVMTGRNNETDYTSFAFVDERDIHLWRKYQGKSEFAAYRKLLLEPAAYEARGYEYLNEGTCRRCNRPLTHPESIETGIGPTCATLQAAGRAS